MHAVIECGFVLPHPCQDRPETIRKFGEDKWKQQSAEWRASMNVGADVKPWTSRKEFQPSGLKHTDRCWEIMDLVALQTLISSGFQKPINKALQDQSWVKKHLGNVLVDLSQNPVRRCFTQEREDSVFDNIIAHLYLRSRLAPSTIGAHDSSGPQEDH